MGKFGDEMVLLPALREIHRRTGVRPVVIASIPYHTIFDGVSYADAIGVPWPIAGEGIRQARNLAWYLFGNSVIPKWWDDPDHNTPEYVDEENRLVLFYGGKRMTLDKRQYGSYMIDQWLRTGFTLEEMTSLPLVFDRRNRQREQELIEIYAREPKKPVLLVNLDGQTSPFSFVPELLNKIRPILFKFHVVDLAEVRAKRIYDLLGLFDIAAGMITVDTATMHLAAASPIPYVGLITQSPKGWGRTTTRGNCIFETYYDLTLQHLDEVANAVRRFLTEPEQPLTLDEQAYVLSHR